MRSLSERELDAWIENAVGEVARKAVEKRKDLFKRLQAIHDGAFPYDHLTEEQRRAEVEKLLRKHKPSRAIAAEIGLVGLLIGKRIRAELEKAYTEQRQAFAEKVRSAGISLPKKAEAYQARAQAVASGWDRPFTKIAYKNIGQNAQMVDRLNRELKAWEQSAKGQEFLQARIQRVIRYEKTYQAKRTAQTERTRVQAQAAYDNMVAYEAAGGRGALEWSCKFHNSRETHKALHGQIRRVGADFLPGVLALPGDDRAPAKEVCNCHCVLIERPLLDDEEVEGGKIVKRESYVLPKKEPNKIEAGTWRTELEEVTEEYERNATPGQGILSMEEGYPAEKRGKEIDASKIIFQKYGGDMLLLKESKDHGVRTPDYLWRGKLWDHKGITSATSADNQTRSGIGQVAKNPGGFVFDISNASISLETILKISERRLIRSSSFSILDLLFINNGKVERIVRFKK